MSTTVEKVRPPPPCLSETTTEMANTPAKNRSRRSSSRYAALPNAPPLLRKNPRTNPSRPSSNETPPTVLDRSKTMSQTNND